MFHLDSKSLYSYQSESYRIACILHGLFFSS